MIYIIPENLLSQIAEINKINNAVPCNVTDEIIVIDVPDDWTEHMKFVKENDLKVYNN